MEGRTYELGSLMILDAHPAPTFPANNDSLDQCRTFPWRCSLALTAILGRIFLEPFLIFLIFLPTNIAGVSVRDERKPLLGRELLLRPPDYAARQLARAATPKTVSPSVTGTFEYPRDTVLNQVIPHQFSGFSSSPNPAGELQPFLGEGLNYR